MYILILMCLCLVQVGSCMRVKWLFYDVKSLALVCLRKKIQSLEILFGSFKELILMV